jgi:hypothetical protein
MIETPTLKDRQVNDVTFVVLAPSVRPEGEFSVVKQQVGVTCWNIQAALKQWLLQLIQLLESISLRRNSSKVIIPSTFGRPPLRRLTDPRSQPQNHPRPNDKP